MGFLFACIGGFISVAVLLLLGIDFDKHLAYSYPPLPAGKGRTPETRVPVLALSPDEAAAAISVSRDYFDEHVMPELRVVRRGRRRLIAVKELERWLDASAALTVG
jgi:hypothetical protein